eukprot:6200378-Pleurochrysis_carterae.AAC.2
MNIRSPPEHMRKLRVRRRKTWRRRVQMTESRAKLAHVCSGLDVSHMRRPSRWCCACAPARVPSPTRQETCLPQRAQRSPGQTNTAACNTHPY